MRGVVIYLPALALVAVGIVAVAALPPAWQPLPCSCPPNGSYNGTTCLCPHGSSFHPFGPVVLVAADLAAIGYVSVVRWRRRRPSGRPSADL